MTYDPNNVFAKVLRGELPAHKIYEDKVTIKATVKRAKDDTSPLEVSIKFQACNDRMCLLPTTVKVTASESP